MSTKLYGYNPHHDVQLWAYSAFHRPITPKTEFYFEPEVRYRDGASQLYFYYFQARLAHDFNKWLTLAVGYRQRYSLPVVNRVWEPAYELMGDAFLKFSIGNWKLLDRNRTQFNMPDGQKTAWLYRNLISVTFPFHIGPVTPVIFNEVFFLERVGFSQNRFAIGGFLKLRRNVKVSTYGLIRQMKASDKWQHQRIIWLMLDTAF